jgi:excisionase family DNA binding protein
MLLEVTAEHNRQTGERMNVAGRLLSVDQSAAYLGLRPRTVRRWIVTGRLPVTRLGRRVLLDKELLDGLIKEKTTLRRG